MDARTLLISIISKCSRATNLNLGRADLADANLSNLSSDGLDLRAADLRRTKLRDARLGTCRLEGASLEDADWSGATLRMCVLDGAHGAGACFDRACLEDSSAKGADLTRASLRDAKLTETSFARAVLREAVLENAEGDGVEFRGADLSGANLIGARLDEADFRGADLRRADLSRGRFQSADFRGAILDGARFDGADCTGAYFDEGAGPRADTAPKADEKITTSSFDQITVAALRDGLTALPSVFATREGLVAELPDHLQHALDMLDGGAAHPPEEWEPWLESLMHMAKDGESVDPTAVLAALRDAPAGLQSVFGMRGGSAAEELLDGLQQVLDRLATATDDPPEEWKPWLESLMKVTQDGGD